MRAELLKVRSLPTPLWCLASVVLTTLLGVVATLRWGIGQDLGVLDVAVFIPMAITSVVFGAWIIGVEYGQHTQRRTLTADPRRARLVLNKLLVAVFLVAVATVLIYVVAFPFYDIAARGHDESVGVAAYSDAALSSLLTNVVYVLIAAGFALITTSMAGGMTAALLFVFVIDTALSNISAVSDYALGVALSKLTSEIRGFDTGFEMSSEVSTAGAVLLVAAWVVGPLALGWLRFWRSEVK